MTTITAIVADDESVARRRLVRMLEESGRASVVAACAGGRDAVERVVALRPDLLFLDVQMPDLDGFQVVEALAGRGGASPAIVFVTAYDQYALRAFDVHAVDYLLKPFDAARFDEALARAIHRATSRHPGDEEQLRALLADYLSKARSAQAEYLDRVAVKHDGMLRIVRTTDVDWWEADGNYVRLHAAGSSFLVRSTMAAIEAQLDPRLFIRVHRRYVVNVDRIVEVQPWFAGDAVAVLRNGAKVRVSRTYRERLHARLGAKTDTDPAS
ncbi:MAG TPA: LytTR family DNA-binding domain-containing protein [Gemmatimonadaceae bacterium]|jgi:two-component system LytT family response regulator|nr:LytTR family DNA-binding domain-containing protein [Gemmatimonadaceae bacterium]